MREHNWKEKAITIAEDNPSRSWRSIARELRVPYSSMTDHLRKHFKGYTRPSELKGRVSISDGSKALESPKKGFKTENIPILGQGEVKPRVLVLDVETSALSLQTFSIWGINAALNQIEEDWNILSYSAKILGEEEVFYNDLRDQDNPVDDKQLCEELFTLLDEVDFVVGHNLRRFDIKKIYSRFMENGVPKPSPFRTIDTLDIARRMFGFTSNKLEFLSEKLCPEYKKSDHSEFSGFNLWKECMKGNQFAWNSMEKYNIQDIIATEQVFLKLAPWDNRLPNFDIYDDEPIDNKEWKHVGYVHTNLGKYDKYRNIVTGQYRRGRTNLLSKDKRATILANIM